LPLAWFGSKVMASLVYKLTVHDPMSLTAAAAGVLIVALVAAWLPARRAASLEPMVALRNE
jgi:ABC-type lipoprotein release transport system permease subunit